MTPRPSALATASTMASGSGVDSTCATLGAVRLQPVSRLVVVADIVTRVPPSPQLEDHRALHNEVDDRCGALRDDERHRHPPWLVVERRQENVVDAYLHGKGHGVEHDHRDESGLARRCLECPATIDQVGRGGARDETK